MKAKEFLNKINEYAGQGVFIIHGEDNYTVDECTFALKKALNADELSVTVLEESFSASDAINVLMSIPFFAEYSIVIAETLIDGEEAEKLAAYIEKLPSHARLIFSIKGKVDKRKAIYKKLTKLGIEVDCSGEEDTASFIVNEAKNKGIEIDYNNACLMLELCGEDRYALKGEVDKLSFLGKKSITRKDIVENVSKSADYNIFLINSLMLKREYDKAFKLAADVIKVEKSAIPLVALLSNRFYQMYMARCCLDNNMSVDAAAKELQKSAKMNFYAAKYVVADAKNFSVEQLKNAVCLLSDYDVALKTGEADMGIEYLLTKLYT